MVKVSRQEFFDQHPVTRNKAGFPTPVIKQVFNIISRTVLQRDPGCSFIATPRIGKSTAITVLTSQIPQSFPRLPVLTIGAKYHIKFNEATFWSECLASCKQASSGKEKSRVLRERLMSLLANLAQSNGDDRLLIFIDEAQNWGALEFTAIRDFTNDLQKMHDATAIVVLFGQPELKALRFAFIATNRLDLVGRFMVQQFQFSGVQSKADLREIMLCYDDVEISEYPPGSGLSYTEFFMPKAFSNGWRLNDEFERLWQTLLTTAGDKDAIEVGMQWIVTTIKNFLMNNLDSDSLNFKPEASDWIEPVMASGFEVSQCLAE